MIMPVKTDAFAFRWTVEEDGYAWIRGADSDPRLVARVSGSRVLLYEPLKASGLFLEFSKLKSQNDILQFANQHGDIVKTYDIGDSAKRQEGRWDHGSSLTKWRAEIGDLRTLVQIWEAIEDRNTKALGSLITWKAKGVRYEIKTPKFNNRAWLAHPELHDTRLARFKPGDVLGPSEYALQAEINRRIADPKYLGDGNEVAIAPRLVWCPGERSADGTPPRPDHHQRLIFKPSSLLAAMWLQFAQAVTGEYQLKRCEGCGKYFQAGPGGRRADASTCSDTCRQRKRRKPRQK